MVSHVSHLESAIDGTRFDFGGIHTTHEDRPLWVAYDMKEARKRFKRDELTEAAPDMWRYAPMLPTGEQVISLGEVMTPLLPCPRLAVHLGVKNLYIKDESRLPTGSFKARGMAVAITMACGLGASTVAVPTRPSESRSTSRQCCRLH